MIDATTKLLGLLGWPAEHSLSPAMQNPALEKLGLNWIYVALPTAPEHLGEAVAGARAMGFIGLNVTIPHKERVRAFLDELDPLAQAIGAVNTIQFLEGRAIGYNTDAAGYTRTVEAAQYRFSGQTILQIGAGGAGRAMAAGSAAAGAARLILADLDGARAARLAEEMTPHFPQVRFEPLASLEQVEQAAGEASLIANATPLGMHPGDPLPLPAHALTRRHTVFDAVYVATRTPLLEAAEKKGARVVHGLGMLARQGARSLQIWSGQQPDEELMLQILREKLGINEQ